MFVLNRFAVLVPIVTSLACTTRQAAWDEAHPAQQPAPPAAKPTPTEPAAPTAAQLRDEAQESWKNRGVQASLERAIELWEQLVEADDTAGLARLSRAHFLLAENFLGPQGHKSKSLATYEKGITAAEQAMLAASEEFSRRVHNGEAMEKALSTIPAQGQAALFWYASNLGRFIAADMTTAAMYKSRIENVMQRVLDLDPTFFHAAPHRFMGAFRAEAPAFLGGDLKTSREHFEKALEIAPNFLETKLLFAEFFATRAKDPELYNRLLTEVVTADPNTIADLLPEQAMVQARARALLDQAREAQAIASGDGGASDTVEN